MLVSVCIPCFNAERYIGAAIDSVLAQTYPHLEVLVVNDGSTDGSRDVLARYDRQITIIEQENRGQCAAANHAFEYSSGDLIKFFDADDILHPEMIARQVARLGSRRDAIAMGEWVRFHAERPCSAIFEPLQMYRDAAPTDWLIAEWENAMPMMQCALWLIPRDIIEKAGVWDQRLSLINDFEYFTRVLTAAEEILYTPGARFFYRSGVSGSLSSQKSRKAVESQYLSLTLGTKHLLKAEYSQRARRACANVLQTFEYEHYPNHSDLRAAIRTRVTELGGADIGPVGPPNFHRLRRVVGWKFARRVQRVLGRYASN